MGNREKLLAAAKQCLFDKGFERTTVRDISTAAGVSMAAIGYHFGSKEALLNAALFEALDSGDAVIGDPAKVGDAPDADPADAFKALWTHLVDSFGSNRTFWVASFEAALRGQRDPELREQMAGGLRQGRSGMAKVLTGVPEDELSPDVVSQLGSVQMALMSGVMLQHLTDPEGAPSAEDVLAGIQALAKLVPTKE